LEIIGRNPVILVGRIPTEIYYTYPKRKINTLFVKIKKAQDVIPRKRHVLGSLV